MKLRGWFLNPVAIGSAFLVACSSSISEEAKGAREFRVELAQVCQGEGVTRATAYSRDLRTIHPILLLAESGDPHDWSDKLPQEWYPTEIGNTELVICVGDEQKDVIQTCRYSGGPSIQRFGYSLRVTLVEAQTGSEISRGEIDGEPPHRCKQTETRSVTKLTGKGVRFSQVEKWLVFYVDASSSRDYGDDHGNDASTSTPIIAGQPVDGSIDPVGDVDFFSFQAKADEVYKIIIELDTLCDGFLTLEDVNGESMRGDSLVPFTLIGWTAPASGIYYLRVEDFECVGTYTVTVSVGLS